MDYEAQRDYELSERAAMEAERREEELDKDDNGPEEEIEPSEEDIALKSLDKEHVEDYLAIKRAVSRTDLAERLVDMAVKLGLKERT